RPASTTEADVFNSGINGGLTPWGLRYDLNGNIGESSGSSAGLPIPNRRGSVSASLTQPVLRDFWIDTTRLNIAVAKNRLKFSEQGLRSRIIDVVTLVEFAYF